MLSPRAVRPRHPEQVNRPARLARVPGRPASEARPTRPEVPVDLFDLTGKVAVVTGGTRGIGLMMARGLLQAGARVYISSRKAEAGDAAVAELSPFGKVVSIPADLSTEAECVRLAVGGRQARGRAAHPGQQRRRDVGRARWRTFPESAWDKVLDLNLKAPFFLTRAFLPLLEEAGDRRRPGADRQRRQHRRAARPADAHLLVLVEQGGAAPPDAGAGQGARARAGSPSTPSRRGRSSRR